MKKILAVLLCAMLVSSTAAISAAAYDSPNIHGDSDNSNPNGGDDDESGKNKSSKPDDGTSSNTGSNGGSDGSSTGSKPGSTTSTSPKTGAPVSYGVLMAAAALAFGGVALSSRKKIEEE